MLNEKGQQQPNVENKEEAQLQEKSKRTAEDIKKVFIEAYGFEEDDPKLEKLVERELSHSKIVSKLIGQKIHYREKATKGEDPENKPLGDGKTDDIRSLEREKAVKKVLVDITKKFNDLGADTAYEKIKEFYKEKGDETLRGDFEKRLWQAFWMSHPDKYEEHIRDKAAKEKDYSADRSSSKLPSKPKQTEKRFFVKQTGPKDWYKAK